jgi:hypothetical protein
MNFLEQYAHSPSVSNFSTSCSFTDAFFLLLLLLSLEVVVEKERRVDFDKEEDEGVLVFRDWTMLALARIRVAIILSES